MDALRERYTQELQDAARIVRDEPAPEARAVHEHVFADRDLVGAGAAAGRGR